MHSIKYSSYDTSYCMALDSKEHLIHKYPILVGRTTNKVGLRSDWVSSVCDCLMCMLLYTMCLVPVYTETCTHYTNCQSCAAMTPILGGQSQTKCGHGYTRLIQQTAHRLNQFYTCPLRTDTTHVCPDTKHYVINNEPTHHYTHRDRSRDSTMPTTI